MKKIIKGDTIVITCGPPKVDVRGHCTKCGHRASKAK